MRTDVFFVKERCEWLIDTIGVPSTRLARLVGLSPSALEKWRHDRLQLSTARVREVANRLQQLGLYGGNQ